MSDHDAQVIVFNNITVTAHKQIFYQKRDINSYSIDQFKFLLSYENWEEVFLESNVNIAFNKFLNIFLRIFYSCFPIKNFRYPHAQKPWVTSGIKVSCANKRTLYLVSRSSSNPNIKEHFKKYCRILTRVIVKPKNYIIIHLY